MKNKDDFEIANLEVKDIRPCDFCKGPIAPIFHVFEIKLGAFNRVGVNAIVGMGQMGFSPALAEVFSPAPLAHVEKHGFRLYCCTECFTARFATIAIACEERSRAKK